MIPPNDRGLLLGDGLFETLLWKDGGLVDFDLHAERMARGCAVLGLPDPDPDSLAWAAARAIEDAELKTARAAVRLNWTAGSGGRGLERPDTVTPRLFALAFRVAPPAGPVSLATAKVCRSEASPLSRIKSLSYLDNVLARREARAAGAEEALMLNTRGEVACAAAANIFWFEGERLCTPALDCGVLDGTVRTRVLEAAMGLGIEAAQVAAPRAVLASATGLFLTNSLIGLRPVTSLDGVAAQPDARLERLAASLSW